MESLLNDNKTILTLIGAGVILLLTIFVVGTYIGRMKSSKADGELTDENWDGIKEFKNDLPIGWALSFIAVIIWGFWYIFVGYPLGSYSQIGEYNKEVSEHNAKYKQQWASLGDSDLVAMGDSIFQVQCSQCHGIDRSGMAGKAADLNKWGRADHIVDVILKGSQGMNYMAGPMVPVAVSAEEAKDIANFVMAEVSAKKVQAAEDSIARGKDLFATHCTACHGPDGKGIEGVDGFAPDLTAYGTDVFLREVLARGKAGDIGKMPSFKYANFDELQEKALNNFIMSDIN